ncbi:hypothetical protein C6P45_003763 [Maudiozyma exigua]|uniref:Uncharacterized protein n=1 Tax=Maudiozyma exigua TaxID=34358 RepID=A0A9P6VTX7_MAUEX|nr:hypothetical protein C6P45_003763 [Kazachstania exigua]
MLLPINIMKYLNDNLGKLKEALIDESYYGRSIYIKDPKYKEIDPFLLKPFQFDSGADVTVMSNQVLYWNTPMIFIGFDEEVKYDIYDSFVDILRSNPIGKNITSTEFLEYMSQPVVFWVKSVGDKEQIKNDEERNEEAKQHYDKLEYKKISNIITSELFKLMRDSYLESIARKLLDPNELKQENYLEPKRLNSRH